MDDLVPKYSGPWTNSTSFLQASFFDDPFLLRKSFRKPLFWDEKHCNPDFILLSLIESIALFRLTYSCTIFSSLSFLMGGLSVRCESVGCYTERKRQIFIKQTENSAWCMHKGKLKSICWKSYISPAFITCVNFFIFYSLMNSVHSVPKLFVCFNATVK